MASCGINEHKEGLRKQSVLDRAAIAQKQMTEGQTSKRIPDFQPRVSGYMGKKGCPPGISNVSPAIYDTECQDFPTMDGIRSHGATDRLQCGHVQGCLGTYSAKVPNRFTSVNYTQQW